MNFIYQIQHGDTGKSVAKNAGVSVEALVFVNANNVRRCQRIATRETQLPIGEFIHIPVVLSKTDLRRLRLAQKER